ncbi:U6 snRNA phosphodiesterase Usb1 [Phlebopus sp. FC_14]|nr:U6 snRNA phosphodiesterase Usb1 [Phlebopus sp. FC_14]
MKRSSTSLVSYSSSEEDVEPSSPPPKKRKLPVLSSSLTIPVPVDNPALHQGRIRTTPHVEGQYAAYIYVPLVLRPRQALYTLVEDALAFSRASVPSLCAIGRQDDNSQNESTSAASNRLELHISLSRPLFLRAHQIEDFKRAIKQVASSQDPFNASFATFSELTNDERTRMFLALEVGAGHAELSHCLHCFGPILQSLRQKEFYLDPKFHASIAWALLEYKNHQNNSALPLLEADRPLDDLTLTSQDSINEITERSVSPSTSTEEFVRIPCFPPDLVPGLNQAFASKLSMARTGGFVVDRIAVKIGKDVFTWPLQCIR